MSYQAVSYVLGHSPIYGKARMVLISLAEHTNGDGLTWPSLDLIARECRMSKTEVHNSVKLLLRSREIVVVGRGGPRSSTRYLMLRFVQTPNVGAPTVQIPSGGSEEIAPDLTVLGAKKKVYSVPAEQIYPEPLAVLTNTDDTSSGTDCIQSELNQILKKRQSVPQRYSDDRFTVLTVTDNTRTSKNHKGTVPAFQSGNGNRHSIAAAACASSGAADGLSPSSRSRSYLRPTDPPLHPSRSPRELKSMREILRHASAAAEGKESFDFVPPDYVPEGEGEK